MHQQFGNEPSTAVRRQDEVSTLRQCLHERLQTSDRICTKRVMLKRIDVIAEGVEQPLYECRMCGP